MDTDTRTNWQARAEAAEAREAKLREALEGYRVALENALRFCPYAVQEDIRAALAQTGGAV